MTPVSALESLRDVQGVLGGFFANRDGDLVSANMPPFFDTEDLEALAPRLAAVVAGCKEAADDSPEHCVLRYGDYHLHLRPEIHGVLCVLSEPTTNLPALRMACRLVARRLGRAPSTIPATPGAINERDSALPPEVRRSYLPPEAQDHSASGPYTPAFPPAHVAAPPPSTLVTAPATVPPVERLAPRVSGSPESRTMPHSTVTPGKSILYRGRRYKV